MTVDIEELKRQAAAAQQKYRAAVAAALARRDSRLRELRDAGLLPAEIGRATGLSPDAVRQALNPEARRRSAEATRRSHLLARRQRRQRPPAPSKAEDVTDAPVEFGEFVFTVRQDEEAGWSVFAERDGQPVNDGQPVGRVMLTVDPLYEVERFYVYDAAGEQVGVGSVRSYKHVLDRLRLRLLGLA